MEQKIEPTTCCCEGHDVEIRMREDGREELWINGQRRKFFKTESGYFLYDDAYEPPQKTLMQAVENYLRKSPAIQS